MVKVQIETMNARSAKGGKEPKNHSPAFDYCRKLIAEGVDPKEKLEVYRGEMLSFTISSLEEGAKYKIRENESEGPKVVKYIPDIRFKTPEKPVS